MASADVSRTAARAYEHGKVPRRVREAQILGLAEQLFSERGYDGMTMDELAARAGVTKPVIYAIVRSKGELYSRCFLRASDQLAEAVSTAAVAHLGDLEGLVRAANLAFFRFIESHAGAFSMLFAEDAGGRHVAQLDRVRARQADLLIAVLTQHSAATGSPIDRRRAELAVHAINGAAEALARWWGRHPETAPGELAAAMTELTLPGLLRLTEGRAED